MGACDFRPHFCIEGIPEVILVPEWRTDYVLPQEGDNLWLKNLLPEKELVKLEKIPAHEIWEGIENRDRSVRWVVLHELFRVAERGFYFDGEGKQHCSLTLQGYREVKRAENGQEEEWMGRTADREPNPERLLLFLDGYPYRLVVPNELPRYPERGEYLSIYPLLSDEDKRQLDGVRMGDGDWTLLETVRECQLRIRKRGWMKDEESRQWCCTLCLAVETP